MLAQQTAINNRPVRMLAAVPARYFVRNRLGVIVAVVVMMMSVIVEMMTIILGRGDRQVGMPRQVRVLAARPGMNYLTK